MRLRYFRQPSLRGGRQPLPSCVVKDIFIEVDHRAKRHKVSRSWVIATHLAEAFGIDEQPDYRKVKRDK